MKYKQPHMNTTGLPHVCTMTQYIPMRLSHSQHTISFLSNASAASKFPVGITTRFFFGFCPLEGLLFGSLAKLWWMFVLWAWILPVFLHVPLFAFSKPLKLLGICGSPGIDVGDSAIFFSASCLHFETARWRYDHSSAVTFDIKWHFLDLGFIAIFHDNYQQQNHTSVKLLIEIW